MSVRVTAGLQAVTRPQAAQQTCTEPCAVDRGRKDAIRARCAGAAGQHLGPVEKRVTCFVTQVRRTLFKSHCTPCLQAQTKGTVKVCGEGKGKGGREGGGRKIGRV